MLRPASLLFVGTVVLFAFHLWLTWDQRDLDPFPGDQYGYLGNARWLSGDSRTYLLPNFPYFTLGYPLVLSPLFRIFQGAEDLFRSIMVLNAVLAACLFPLLYGSTRVLLRASRPVAGAAALVGAVVPAVTYHAAYAMAENLVFPLLAATVLACWLMLSARPLWTRVLFGPAVVLLYMTHERFTPVVPLAIVIILVGKRLGLSTARVATVNLGTIFALGFVAFRLKKSVVSARWVRGINRPQGTLLSEFREDVVEPVLRFASRPTSVLPVLVGGLAVALVVRGARRGHPGHPTGRIARWGASAARLLRHRRVRLAVLAGLVVLLVLRRVALWRFVLEAVGQAWYVAAGSLGFAVVGLVFVFHQLGPAPPGARPWTGLADRLGEPRRLTVAFLLLSGISVFVASTLFFADNQGRSDHYLYGRHNDSFVPLWVAAGVAFVLSRRGDRPARVRLMTAGATIALAVVLFLGRGEAGLDGIYARFAVPAINPFVPEGLFSLGVGLSGAGTVSTIPWATGAAVLAMAALFGVSRLGRTRLAATVTCVALAGAWLLSAGAEDLRPRREPRDWPAIIEDLGIEAEVAIDLTRPGGVPVDYQWRLPELAARPWNLTDRPGTPYVFASIRSRTLRKAEGQVAFLDNAGGIALWVLPGREQERLRDEERLVLRRFPGPLPTWVGRVELELTGGAGPVVRIAPGGSATIGLEGRHVGSVSPWPGRGSFDRDGRMQLRSRPRLIGAAARRRPVEAKAELPPWILPGQSFRTSMVLRAEDHRGRPLPPGRYSIGVDVHQVGRRWFTPPGGEALDLVLEVTG